MRIEQDISSHMEEQARRNLKRAIPFLFAWFVLFITGLDYLPTYINFGNLTAPVNFLSGCVFVYGIMQFLVPYSNWKMGLRGERRVTDNISKKLGSEHSLFNDVVFKDGRRENIDHIIVGPRGVFAIETKNTQRAFTVYGDTWNGFVRSPSSQAKRHARRVYDVLRNANFRDGQIPMVNAIVVLANRKAKPDVKVNPYLCKVIMIKNEADTSLYEYVMAQDIQYSTKEIDEIVDILQDKLA